MLYKLHVLQLRFSLTDFNLVNKDFRIPLNKCIIYMYNSINNNNKQSCILYAATGYAHGMYTV